MPTNVPCCSRNFSRTDVVWRNAPPGRWRNSFHGPTVRCKQFNVDDEPLLLPEARILRLVYDGLTTAHSFQTILPVMMQSGKNVAQQPDRWYFQVWQREIFLSWYYEITFRGAAMLASPRIRDYALGCVRCSGMRHGANSVVASRAGQYGVRCNVYARQIAKTIPSDVRQAIAAGTRFAESLKATNACDDERRAQPGRTRPVRAPSICRRCGSDRAVSWRLAARRPGRFTRN